MEGNRVQLAGLHTIKLWDAERFLIVTSSTLFNAHEVRLHPSSFVWEFVPVQGYGPGACFIRVAPNQHCAGMYLQADRDTGKLQLHQHGADNYEVFYVWRATGDGHYQLGAKACEGLHSYWLVQGGNELRGTGGNGIRLEILVSGHAQGPVMTAPQPFHCPNTQRVIGWCPGGLPGAQHTLFNNPTGQRCTCGCNSILTSISHIHG